MNINKKITLKGLTANIPLLLSSNYCLCEVSCAPQLQIPVNKFDVVSINNNLFVHKHIIGSYFTYRVSSSKTDEFFYNENYGDYKLRSGSNGIITVLNTKEFFNEF